jgi:hypothetical protein
VIRRETDAALINSIANHPQVLPFFDLGRTGELDFTECVERPDDYVILTDGEACASIWEWSAPGVWQGHSLFLPEVRGRAAVSAGRAMGAWMLEHVAAMLWGSTPTILRHALWFNRAIGFQPAGIGFHHLSGEVQHFVMRKSNGCSSGCSGGHFSRGQPVFRDHGRQGG